MLAFFLIFPAKNSHGLGNNEMNQICSEMVGHPIKMYRLHDLLQISAPFYMNKIINVEY